MANPMFDVKTLPALASDLAREIGRVYEASVPMPTAAGAIPAIPRTGRGMARLPELWSMIADRSAHLASPWMSGHMDTAPHPAAALTASLVAALNNNLLFRELSPFASDIEEQLIAHFAKALGLGEDWGGLFASGGSIAGLTALFAAVGGYAGGVDRERVHLFLPESCHLSLKKSATVLGLGARRIHTIACDDAGRMDPAALTEALRAIPLKARAIVVSVLGTTIHGSVDDVEAIGAICKRFDAWHHVDAIYGGALAYSKVHRGFLSGLAGADSVAIGPQKWMYVPRVSAICFIRGRDRLEAALGVALPYSLGGQPHRGRFGLQGSRPADAVVLWASLQTMGTDALGAHVDRMIDLAGRFHRLLAGNDLFEPAHVPDLNLQVFRVGGRDETGARLAAIQANPVANQATWMSISRWRDETYLRCVLLSPSLTEAHLEQFLLDVARAAN